MITHRAGWGAVMAVCVGLVPSCKNEPRDAPKPAPETTPTSKAHEERDEAAENTPAIRALPPEQAFARSGTEPVAPAGPAPIGTGVCAFIEKSYDGQDTPSTEKMVVKIKDGRIVRVTYSYRGSYGMNGEADNLTIPISEGQWTAISLPTSSGKQEFKVKLKGKTMTFKGTATDTPEGDCVWNASGDE
jgi:hypothetical protein